jgi:hypothetical protein
MIDTDEIRRLIADPAYSHSRAGNGIFRGGSHIYHRAETPTGVVCVGFAEDAIHDPILRELRNTSALSPTEGLRGSRGW